MVVEPVVPSSKSEENYLFISGEGMIVITLRTLPKVGLDDGPLLEIAQVFLNLYFLCTFFSQSVSGFISWNTTVGRDLLESDSVGLCKRLQGVSQLRFSSTVEGLQDRECIS